MRVTTGAIVSSTVMLSVLDRVLLLVAVSVADRAGTDTVSDPALIGVTVAWYIVELSGENPDTLALLTTNPDAENPDTGSENVARVVNEPLTVVIPLGTVVSVTVGETIS